ncbi:MAG: MFS transporter [Rhodospirillaceae bacterium]|nr:MFS transporter [Rhodospirillaceae bacterium]
MVNQTLSYAKQSDLFGHPRGLVTLFMTEMWERFSYYGMRALLVLFMVATVEDGGLEFSDQNATAIYGLYTAAVFLGSLPGGWIADRLMGAQSAVWAGGIIIMLGHFVLAIPSDVIFFLGLIVIVLGTGLLKPNITAIVGDLYERDDPRRDSGFTIFYMGINLGAALGPLVCGWLAIRNWHYGFAAAGFGMLFGLIQFYFTRHYLGAAGRSPDKPEHQTDRFTQIAWLVITIFVVLVGCLFIAGVLGLVVYDAVQLSQGATYVIVTVAAVYFLYIFVFSGLTEKERGKMALIFVLISAATVFWIGSEQAGSSLNLFAERYTIREFGNFVIPASWFQSANPIFIILLAPLYSMFWVALAKRHMDPSSPLKLAIGLIILGVAFAVMIGAAALVAEGQQVLPSWLIFTYLFMTMGELALSPVGMSAITKLSPRRLVGQMMGVWFLSLSLGSILAGLFAGGFSADAVDEMPGLYMQLVLMTVGAGVILMLASGYLKRLAGEDRNKN